MTSTALHLDRDLSIPAPPRRIHTLHIAEAVASRRAPRAQPQISAWRQAMLGALVGLSGSLLLGEVLLWLAGP